MTVGRALGCYPCWPPHPALWPLLLTYLCLPGACVLWRSIADRWRHSLQGSPHHVGQSIVASKEPNAATTFADEAV
eukprot:3667229-Alexandrium_andersonii.AAC.1